MVVPPLTILVQSSMEEQVQPCAMERRLLLGILDFGLIVLAGLSMMFIELFWKPFRRGFFCDDDSIQYPYHSSTVSNTAILVVPLLVPLIVITILECLNERSRTPSSLECAFFKRLFTLGEVRWLKMSGFYLFGIATTGLIFMLGKVTVGRLRPHFIAVCRPDVVCNATMSDIANRYITDYTCLNPNESEVNEARKSFPSGHSAIAFYAAVFTMMYLQYSVPRIGSKLVRHFIQLVLFLSAFYTGLSRVFDYHHHWSDVLAGMLIGTLAAMFTILFVSDLRRYYAKPRSEDEETALVFTAPA